MDLKEKIRTIPDWPIKGVMFRDITTLLQDGEAFRYCCDELYNRYKGARIDKIAAIESRGFIFGAVLAYRLGVGLIPIRKKGKLPYKTTSHTYQKEYGPDTIEVHIDAIKKGESVLIVDDLIATGGTVEATIALVEKLGATIFECAFVVGLPDLKGIDKLKGYNVYTMVDFEGE